MYDMMNPRIAAMMAMAQNRGMGGGMVPGMMAPPQGMQNPAPQIGGAQMPPPQVAQGSPMPQMGGQQMPPGQQMGQMAGQMGMNPMLLAMMARLRQQQAQGMPQMPGGGGGQQPPGNYQQGGMSTGFQMPGTPGAPTPGDIGQGGQPQGLLSNTNPLWSILYGR